MKDIFTLHAISKQFADEKGRHHFALKNISFSVENGEFFVLIGPSGCGKSTLLRILAGLETETTGAITMEHGLAHGDLGFVFQQFALLPWLTVYGNIELGLLSREPHPTIRHQKIMAIIDELRLTQFTYAHPHELSGGMRQRVGFARALVTEPKILLLDEPFSELDTFTAEELRQELLRIWALRKMTIVLVSHNIPETIALADRIGVLSARPGTLIEIVHNPLARPRDLRSAQSFALEDKLRDYLKQ